MQTFRVATETQSPSCSFHEHMGHVNPRMHGRGPLKYPQCQRSDRRAKGDSAMDQLKQQGNERREEKNTTQYEGTCTRTCIIIIERGQRSPHLPLIGFIDEIVQTNTNGN